MNRREALQRTALTLGYAISAPLAAAVLNGCKAKPELAFKPKFFNEEQARLVSAISEAILPRTNTPGAIEAGVPGFIDDMVGTVYSPEDQKSFIDGLMNFDQEATAELGDRFFEIPAEQQLTFITKKNSEALAGGNSGQSEG